MEKLMANKKLLIGICVAVVIIVVAVICVAVAKPSYKKQIKEFAAAMEDGDKMEKFTEKYVNYRAWYAMEKMEEDENLDHSDSKAVKKAFEKAYKDAKKSDYDSDKIKDEVKTVFGMMTMYTSMAGEDAKVEIKDIGKLKDGDEDFSFMKQAEFKLKITAGGESTESKWRALFYKGKFVMAAPIEEGNSDLSMDESEDFGLDYEE